MRIFTFLYCFCIFFFAGFQVKCQDFTGKVKDDTAFVEIMVPSFTGWETIAQQWGISAERLQRCNPAILPSSTGIPAVILVPLHNLLQNDPCEGCFPVYHSVGKSEGLYRIGKWYGNQPVAVLKKRNNLRSDALSPGQKLLVGYVSAIGRPAVLPDTSTQAVAKKDTAISLMEVSGTQEIKDIPKPPPPRKFLSYSGEGVFAGEFSPEAGAVIKKAGKASFFKSESGWTDGRFYVLNSNLKAGLVVKISNPSSGVFLYAKVVGPLPEIKQNQGLSMRLNNAAAAMLGLWEEEKSYELTWEY